MKLHFCVKRNPRLTQFYKLKLSGKTEPDPPTDKTPGS
jgi:hypothetical protein